MHRYRKVKLVAAALLLGGGSLLVGCPGGTVDVVCDGIQVTVTPSAGANSTSTGFTPSQCDVTLSGSTLTIDLLDRTGTADRSPRVLISVNVGAALAAGSIDLARANDTDLAPAVYQEFTGPDATDPMLADGPFWSSNAGSLDLMTGATGDLVADFNFTADNPRPDMPSMATGTVTVTGGSIVVMAGSVPEMCGACGNGALGAGLLISLTLGVLRQRRL